MTIKEALLSIPLSWFWLSKVYFPKRQITLEQEDFNLDWTILILILDEITSDPKMEFSDLLQLQNGNTITENAITSSMVHLTRHQLATSLFIRKGEYWSISQTWRRDNTNKNHLSRTKFVYITLLILVNGIYSYQCTTLVMSQWMIFQ